MSKQFIDELDKYKGINITGSTLTNPVTIDTDTININKTENLSNSISFQDLDTKLFDDETFIKPKAKEQKVSRINIFEQPFTYNYNPNYNYKKVNHPDILKVSDRITDDIIKHINDSKNRKTLDNTIGIKFNSRPIDGFYETLRHLSIEEPKNLNSDNKYKKFIEEYSKPIIKNNNNINKSTSNNNNNTKIEIKPNNNKFINLIELENGIY